MKLSHRYICGHKSTSATRIDAKARVPHTDQHCPRCGAVGLERRLYEFTDVTWLVRGCSACGWGDAREDPGRRLPDDLAALVQGTLADDDLAAVACDRLAELAGLARALGLAGDDDLAERVGLGRRLGLLGDDDDE